MPRLRRSAASAMTRHLARGRSNAQFKEKSKTPYPKQSCRGVYDRKTGYAWITGKGNGRLATEKCFSHCVAQKPLSITASGRGTRRAPKLYPQSEISILGITTRGDQWLDQPLSKIGGKGLFIKELEQALADGRADLAVHSLKDMPAVLPAGFKLAA